MTGKKIGKKIERKSGLKDGLKDGIEGTDTLLILLYYFVLTGGPSQEALLRHTGIRGS